MVSELLLDKVRRDTIVLFADTGSDRGTHVVIIEIFGHLDVVLAFVSEESDHHVKLVHSLALLVRLTVGSLDLVVLKGGIVLVIIGKLLILLVFIFVMVEDQHLESRVLLGRLRLENLLHIFL